ncbi:hypothetical protein FOA52_005787 [Chlamydomonas sp. UWO 241]|nr:hypothetical protein FOA52_005787 [Chlamydomonas sp. UWO 241]
MRIVEESNRIQVIKELRDLVEHKEHFMSSMSHELRTPLNGIIGLSDSVLIGSCGGVNEQLAKTMNSVKLSGSRLLNLINDILDAASMRKVLHNLIGNSCKFTHHGCIWVNAQLVGDRVEVSVNDSGIGIAEDKFESIFEAFKQVDEGTARKYGGTGLGLNLVKQLVEAHGGTIRVASLPHELTSFTFDLQMAAAAAADRIARRLEDVAAGGRLLMSSANGGGAAQQSIRGLMDARASTTSVTGSDPGKVSKLWPRRLRPTARIKVLSVDDDFVNQMVIQNLLVPEGFHVDQAMDGQEALQMLESAEELPDIVLLDLMMPGMSGYEVAKHMRALYPLACIPIIMITAKMQEDNVVRGFECGINDYLLKPFGRQELLARVRAHLQFKDGVLRAGVASCEELMTERLRAIPGQMLQYMDTTTTTALSLPPSLKAEIELDGTQHSSLQLLQMFTQLTMVVAKVSDMTRVVRELPLTSTMTACQARVMRKLIPLMP